MKVKELRRLLADAPDDIDVVVANDHYWGYTHDVDPAGEADLTGGGQLIPVFIIRTDNHVFEDGEPPEPIAQA